MVFLDYGLYVVKKTINIPAGARIVGEGYPVIMGNGEVFGDMQNPTPVFKVGAESGAKGRVEFSEFIVSTKGPAAGAVLVEYNFAASDEPSGFWDFHTRVGGFAGSDFQIAQCKKVVGSPNIDEKCISAYMAVHATKQSSGLYMENTWIWTADHDIEDPTNEQITIYSGRGICKIVHTCQTRIPNITNRCAYAVIESTEGNFWLVGGASEHFHLYRYQFANTKNIFGAMLQTETP